MSRLPVGSNYCLCAACGEYFTTASNFDAHRAGKAGERHCLTTAEIEEKGFRKNPKGYWRKPASEHWAKP